MSCTADRVCCIPDSRRTELKWLFSRGGCSDLSAGWIMELDQKEFSFRKGQML